MIDSNMKMFCLILKNHKMPLATVKEWLSSSLAPYILWQLSGAELTHPEKDEYNGRGGHLSTSQVALSEHPFGEEFYKAFIQGIVA